MKKSKQHTASKGAQTRTKIKDFPSPKGMRDLMNDEYYFFQGFFEKAQEIAIYYGFKPIETPILEKEDIGYHVDTIINNARTEKATILLISNFLIK